MTVFTFICMLLGILFAPYITLGIVLINIGGTGMTALGTISFICGVLVGVNKLLSKK